MRKLRQNVKLSYWLARKQMETTRTKYFQKNINEKIMGKIDLMLF